MSRFYCGTMPAFYSLTICEHVVGGALVYDWFRGRS